MSPLTLLLMIGAVARLTHLVTTDVISEPFREWVEEKEVGVGGYKRMSFNTLINCPWCCGFWISAGVVTLTWAFGDHTWLQFIWAGMTASYAVGYLEEKL